MTNKRYCGIGKIQYIPLSEGAHKIANHHFIIIKNNETIELLDIECGLAEGFLLYDGIDIQKEIKNAVERLAKMILKHALVNIKEYGLDYYNELMHSDFSKEYLAIYENIKQQIDPLKTKENVKEKNFKVNSNFKSTTQFSYTDRKKVA